MGVIDMRVAAVFGVDDGDRAPPFILDLVMNEP